MWFHRFHVVIIVKKIPAQKRDPDNVKQTVDEWAPKHVDVVVEETTHKNYDHYKYRGCMD